MNIPLPVITPSLPANNATYSQAVRMGGFVFVSGQLGIDPKTRELVAGGIQAETAQAIDNIATVLAAAGSALERVAKVTIFLTDFSLLSQMNEVYALRFPHRPAKTTVEINRLDKNATLEMEVIAGCDA